MRWRPTRIDDTAPRLKKCNCGGNAQVIDAGAVRILCQRCGVSVTSEAGPFFRDAARQREHQTWRAALAWNGDAQDRQG